MPTNFPTGLLNRGVPVEALSGAASPMFTNGVVYHVDSGHTNASDTNSGTNPNHPMATIDAAIGRCTASRGDIVLVAPGHSETTTAVITMDVAGVKVVGMGNGTLRPQITVNANVDAITITAANCEVHNIYFNEGTNAHTARINIAGAFAKVIGCHFDCGANDLESITIAAAGTDAEIAYNEWRVTANGPDAAIEIEAAGAARLSVHHNLFDGGSAANGWDAGAINSGVAHTLCHIYDNQFLFMATNQGGVEFTAAATGLIHDNFFGGGTLGEMLDPGSCYCWANYEQDAVDESGRIFPALNPDGSGIPEVLDQLSGANGIASFPAAGAAPANNVSIAEVLRAVYDTLQLGENIGEADIDIDQADYTAFQNLITIVPDAGTPLYDVEIHFDVAKATTGFVAGHTTETIQFAVARKVDGTNWRRDIDSSTTARAANLAGLQGQSISIGDVGPDEEVRVEVVLSAENAVDVEMPYALYYRSNGITAPTVTPVAAA